MKWPVEFGFTVVSRYVQFILWLTKSVSTLAKTFSFFFGRSFTLITDHKPLLSVLSGQKPTSAQASARIRRWSLFFSMFEYNIKFRVLLTEHLDSSLVTASQIKQSTMCDPELAMVFEYVQHGWPGKSAVSSSLNPFYQRKEELSVLNGCLLWGAQW